MFPDFLYSSTYSQPLQLLQGLQLYRFSSRDSVSLLHWMNHHCTWVKHLMPTLSMYISGPDNLCRNVNTLQRFRNSTYNYRMDNVTRHQLVRPTPSQCRQLTVAETWEWPCHCVPARYIHMSRETLVCVIVVLAYKIYLILIIYQIDITFPVCVRDNSDFTVVVHCSNKQ